jgi:hypothetical protein
LGREERRDTNNGWSLGRGRRGPRGSGGIQKKMRQWVLAVAILAAASAAALLLGAEAQQQGHQTERISGERWRTSSSPIIPASISVAVDLSGSGLL